MNLLKLQMKANSILAVSSAICFLARLSSAAETVQINLSEIFNSRPVTTMVDGKAVLATSSIDPGSSSIATKSAAAALGFSDPNSLPDNGVFPANDQHPEIVCAYGKDDGKMNFVARLAKETAVTFTVPSGKYSRLILMTTSAGANARFTAELKYQDGSADMRAIEISDWWYDLKAGDTSHFYVTQKPGLSKWMKDKRTENDHHYIFGVDLQPDPKMTLASVCIKKELPGVLTLFAVVGRVN